MSKVIDIFSAKIILPEITGEVEEWGYADNTKMQYWRRKPLPDYFNEVEYDKDGNALLTHQQRIYAVEEVRRCKEGFAFMNNGIKTFITGKY